jgi:tetratricopeptide (TPR) repeat protein
MPRLSIDRENSENGSRGKRLDGWKEIATYLGRGERTVKRWEADRALPTHRIPGAGRATVYAYSTELDEWLKSRKSRELYASDKEEEQAEPVEVSQIAHSSHPETALPGQQSTAAQTAVKFKWRSASAGLLTLVVLAATVFVAFLRPGAWISRRAPALFANGHPKATASAVSDSEKNLAHDFYLKGRYAWGQRTPDSLNSALDYFTQAVVHNPGDASAYVGLADTYDLLFEYSTMPERDAYARSIAAARRAVELDDSLAEAHRALGFAEFYGSWDLVDSEMEFRRAIQLNPNDPVARRWYANAFAVPGRFDESLEQISKAQELDPSSHSTLSDKGIMLCRAGKTAEGMALLHEVERIDPQFLSPHRYLNWVNFELHDYPTYLAEGQKEAEIAGDPILKDIFASALEGYAQGGERGLLNNLYAKQKQYFLAGKVPGAFLAKTCVRMGRKEEAIQFLEEDYARHDSRVFFCLSDPDLLTLKDEPDFLALIKKINFPTAPLDEKRALRPR